MKLFYTLLLPLMLLSFSVNSFGQVDVDPEPYLGDPCPDSLDLNFVAIESADECVMIFILDTYPIDPLNPAYVLSFEWDYGDGTTELDQGQAAGFHIYATAGTYTVCVTAWTTNGEDCCKTTFCKEVVVETGCSLCDELENFDFNLEVIDSNSVLLTSGGTLGTYGYTYGYLLDYGNGLIRGTTFPRYMHYIETGVYDVSVTIFYVNPATGECCSYKVTKTIVIRPGRGVKVTDALGEESTTISIPSNNVALFPNPSRGEFTLQATNNLNIETVTVYNLTGEVLYQLNDIQNMKEVQMDLQHLSSGMYYIMINETNEENRAFKQLVIE
jgi:PKD repeat protein